MAKAVQFGDTLSENLKKLAKGSDALVKRALGQIGLRVIRDIVIDEPRPPLQTGFLRGSGAVYVEDKLLTDSTRVNGNGGAVKGNILGSNPEAENQTLTVAFNTPYAAIQDQMLSPEGSWQSRFQQDGLIGGGFISTKVASKRYQDTWMKIGAKAIAEGIEQELK